MKKKIIEDQLGEEYLKNKIKKDDKIILGQGNFGKVKLGISLFKNVVKPGTVICIKKSIKNLSPK